MAFCERIHLDRKTKRDSQTENRKNKEIEWKTRTKTKPGYLQTQDESMSHFGSWKTELKLNQKEQYERYEKKK